LLTTTEPQVLNECSTKTYSLLYRESIVNATYAYRIGGFARPPEWTIRSSRRNSR